MTPDSSELFDSFTQSIVKKDIEKMMDLFNDDATYIMYAQPYKPVSGKHSLRAFMQDEFTKIEGYKSKKLFVCEKKDSIVVEWLVYFKNPATGKQNEVQGVSIVETKNGKIQTWKEYLKQ